MALSLALSEAGASPQSVRSEAKVHLRQEDGVPTISRIDLTTVASVDGVDEAGFQEAAEATRKGCIVSRALAGVNEITLDATLES
jgi:osmotically inducible protein OsmC